MVKRTAIFLILVLFLFSSDAIVRREELTYRKVGTGYSLEFTRTMRRLSEFARTYWADPRIIVEDGEKFAIKAAYTVNSEGKKIDVPKVGIHLLTPRGLERFPYYSFLKERAINFLGIDLPSESTLSYTLKKEDGEIDETYPLAEPALSKEKTWNFFGFHQLSYDAPGQQLETTNIQIGGERGIQIRVKNIPPYPKEPNQFPSPVFIYSSREGWENLGNEVSAVFSQEEGLSKNSLSLVNAKNDLDILPLLKEILSLVRIPMKYSLFKARSGEEAFQSRYASPVEMVLILMDIYDARGRKALPFLAADAERFSERVPAISQFTDAGIYLPELGIYIDSNLKPRRSFHDKVLWILLPKPHFLRFPPLDPLYNSIKLAIKVNDKSIEGKLIGKGNFIFYGDPKEEAEKWLSKAGISAKIEEANILGNTLNFTGKTKENNLRILPDFSMLPKDPEAFSLPRITPIWIKEPFGVDIKIELETSGQIIYIPPDFSLSNPEGIFTLNSKVEGKKAEIHYRLSVKKGLISPEKTEALKKIWATARDKSTTYIIYLPE